MNFIMLSLRYIRSRKLESALAILGIVLGVATLAGTLSLVSSYRIWYDQFSQSPDSRQISIRQATRVRVSDDAAVLIGVTESENIEFTADEVQAAFNVCPAVEAFYDADYRTFYTTASTMAASGFQGGPGGGGQGPEMNNSSTQKSNGYTTTTDHEKASIQSETSPVGAGGPSGDSLNQMNGAVPDDPFAGEAGGPNGLNRNPGGMPPNEGMFGREQEQIDTSLEKTVPEKISGAMVTGGFFNAYSLQAKYGDVFSDAGGNTGVPGVVLGAAVAGNLYAGVTDPSRLIGKKLILNNTPYDIIGILAEDVWNSAQRNITFNEMVFVPTFDMRAGGMRRIHYRNVTYTARKTATPAQAAIQLENYFNSIYGQGAVVAEANLDRFSREVTKRQRILTLMTMLSAACALTAAINLFNLMTSRVVRRRRPIAIMRAIGARSTNVFAQIIVEAAIIGTVGTLGGMVLSPVVVRILSTILDSSASNRNIPVSVRLPVLVAVGFGALCISLLFAVIPARNGSKLVITDALRSE